MHDCMGRVGQAPKVEVMPNGDPLAPAKQMVTRYALQNQVTSEYLTGRSLATTLVESEAYGWEFMSGAEMAHFAVREPGSWKVVAISREVEDQAPDV